MSLIVSAIETKALQLADAATGDFSTASDVLVWVNEAQREIVKNTDCLVSTTPQTITTTVSENTYALSADFSKEQRVTVAGDKAYWTDFDELKELIASGDSVNEPRYVVRNSRITIYSGVAVAAGVSIVVEYFRLAADVTSSSSATEIPITYYDTIQFYVASMMAEANADYSLAERRMSQFYNRLSSSKLNEQRVRGRTRKIKTEVRDKYSF